MVAWRELGGAARGIGTPVSVAVSAAGQRDRDDYEAAVAELAALPPDQAGQVLGAVVRALLEEQHPDGLDSDDIQTVLSRCYRGAIGWLPAERVDPHTLIAVLASALGIHEPGVTYTDITAKPPSEAEDWVGDPVGGSVVGGGGTEEPQALRVPTPADYAWHAPLMIADQLATGRRRLDSYLDLVFAEIVRAEMMELP